MDKNLSVQQSIVIPELYFLISKFLTAGPLQETAKVLVKELERKKALPKRIDWLGEEHDQSFDELERKYAHIGPNHLLEICSRIGPILDKELCPSVQGIVSLLGGGRQNLLRTSDSICRPRTLQDYHTRLHGTSIPDSANCKSTHNLAKVLFGRESGGTIRRKLVIPANFYGKINLLRRTLGHLSAVYCVLFDRSGRYIITGADDLLVKLWSAVDGRLLATFRGASAEITDIAINLDNTLMAAGSLDRILRVWDLQTTAPIAVLLGHTGMITSVNFCPSPSKDLKYLVTTSTDGSVAFWQYVTPRGGKTIFGQKPTQYHEKIRPGQAQMICAAFSPGGIFLAAGSADHHVRVYIMQEEGPKRILETEAHTDAVDSIQWAHQGLRFVSGSKDGTAHVWSFESQQWKSMKLNMSDRLPSCPEPEEGKKIKVTMVAWDFSDKWIITAVNDFAIKIWCSRTGKLHRVLRGHHDELYVLESHPIDENVLLSAGHDGQLFIWDIESGLSIARFLNNIDGQGHGGVFDAKWSPDGTIIAATDSHGHILMFGFGDGHQQFKSLPRELFFHTDYRPLIRDAAHMVLDEQTQMMPHLMPPPFLVDIDGNPHPPKFQRLVPGRENCPSDQLIPNISVGPEGVEVVDQQNYSHLDRLIQALANRQDQAPDSNNDRASMERFNNERVIPERLNNNNANVGHRLNNSPRGQGAQPVIAAAALNGPNGHRVGLRRTGSVEGVRQSVGNWQRETFKFMRRIFVKPMKYAVLQTIKQNVYSAGLLEQDIYRREMRRRPIMINTANNNTPLQILTGRARGRGRVGRIPRNARNQPVAAYRTRAVREAEPRRNNEETNNRPNARHEEEEEEEEESSNSSNETSYSSDIVNEEMLSQSSSSDTESSDYSDWVADKPGPNLEPPKRVKRKRVDRRNASPSSDTSQQPGPSSSTSRPKNVKKKITAPPNGEIPEIYKPAEWLSEVIPRKAPYYPQMGDEIVYFRQGHARYLETVREKKVFKVTQNLEPWNTVVLDDHEIVRVIGIKYEIKPPRLCCLKLAVIDESGQMTDKTFTIKYHDMPDVLDFLVLRQTYDMAVRRNWAPNDRFRCMIDDGWWMGKIESHRALSPEFPDSLFMCFRVLWDNGEYEYMSPWDMEPIDEERLPDVVGGAVLVLPEELRATLYQPKSEEWPRGDREASCRRIVNGLEQVMSLAIADAFLAPVDLNIYPTYAYTVEYPIDLTTIKARFENHFYRRITSAQFDVRYLATNAEKFNKPHSIIVKNARIITELCLRIIRDYNDVDVNPLYHQLMATYTSSESENDDNDNDAGPSTSVGASSSTRRTTNGSRRSKRLKSSTDWRVDCRELLEMLWQCDDSTPFREPVDTLEHSDYLQIIEAPMDLRTVKEDLLGGNYENPVEFAKDVRLIFTNSRNYNTNKKSRIYSMTLRLSTLFETHIKEVLYNWKASRRRALKNSSSPSKKTSPQQQKRDPTKRPSTRGNKSNGTAGVSRVNQNEDSSDEDDDDDDDEMPIRPKRGEGSRAAVSSNRRNGTARSATCSGSNGVTSTQHNEPGSSGRILRGNRSQPNSQEEDEEDQISDPGHSSESESTASSSSSSSDSSDESGLPVNDSNVNRRIGQNVRRNERDSEDSYDPRGYIRKKSIKRKRKSKKNELQNRVGRRQIKKPKRFSNNEDEEDDDNEDDDYRRSNKQKSNKRRIKCNSRRKTQSSDNNSGDDTQRSTQNNVKSPKKRGRPPRKDTQSEDSGEISQQANRQTQPHRAMRTNRQIRPEVDHSYHLTERDVRRQIIESDTEEQEVTRPTRSSIRRALMEWAKVSDDELDAETEVQKRKTNRRKKVSESDQSDPNINAPSTSRSRNHNDIGATRQVRTNRNSRVVQEDDSDDEPLVLSQQNDRNSRTRAVRNMNEFDIQNGTATAPLRTSTAIPTATITSQSFTRQINAINRRGQISHHVTRSSSNLDSLPSSSTNTRNNATISVNSTHVQNDHNYGESSSRGDGSTINQRNTRRMLSRHQRNADELDSLASDEIDPLDMTNFLVDTSVSTTISTRLRGRTNNLVTPPSEPVSVVRTLHSQSNHSQEHITTLARSMRQRRNQPRSYREDDDEQISNRNQTTTASTRAQTNLIVNNTTNNNSEDDSEDNQPLTFVAAASSSRRSVITSTAQHQREQQQRQRLHNESTGSQVEPNQTSNKRSNIYGDDSGDEDDDDGPLANLTRHARNMRRQKRLHYNENSDENSTASSHCPRKRQQLISNVIAAPSTFTNSRQLRNLTSNNNSGGITLRTLSNVVPIQSTSAAATTDYDDDLASDNDEQTTVSVSSRGRIRKITAKARGLFKE